MKSSSSFIIGIDVGGTKIHGAVYEVISGKGQGVGEEVKLTMIVDQRVATNLSRGFDSAVEQVIAMVSHFKSQAPNVSAIGIGLPGLVDQERGTFFSGGNVKTTNPFPIKTFLNDRVGLPVAIDNDARCFVVAEQTLGQARGYRNVIGLTLGTGLGSGIIIDGNLLRGSRGLAPEIGATLVQMKNEEGESSHTRSKDMRSFEDMVASKAPDEIRGRYLSILITNLLRTFNPDAIALGGGIIERRWTELEPQIWAGVKKLCPELYWKDLKIYASKLEHPATLGAALLNLK